MASIDLDALRAARNEAAGEPNTLRVAGKEFRLPPSLPLSFAVALERDSTTEALKALLGEQMDEFLSLGVDYADLADLIGETVKLYTGRSPGESKASVDSSQNGGKRSRRTSPGSTPASVTSPKPASAPSR
jgi:hypothetical protein